MNQPNNGVDCIALIKGLGKTGQEGDAETTITKVVAEINNINLKKEDGVTPLAVSDSCAIQAPMRTDKPNIPGDIWLTPGKGPEGEKEPEIFFTSTKVKGKK